MDKTNENVASKGLNNKTTRFLIIWIGIVVILLLGSILVPAYGAPKETVGEMMRDAVLHEENRINFFGFKDVNPSLISGFIVTAILLIVSVFIRIFVIPKFKYVPGKFQLALEQAVSLFDNMAKGSSPHRNTFLSAYIFCAGAYIFFGTIFELFGVQVIASNGRPVTLPAPFADINSAIMIAALSYIVIFSGAIAGNGLRGVGSALKEATLLISMTFRIFGALLSGLLVTELVYYYTSLSYGLPVLVAVMFTLLHALIQTYVLTMLTSMFYGEKSEPKPKKKKRKSKKEYQAWRE